MVIEYQHPANLGRSATKLKRSPLYEVMTFPAFDRRLRDIALVPPKKLSKKAWNIIHSEKEANDEFTRAAAPHSLESQRIFHAVRHIVRGRGFFKLSDAVKDNEVNKTSSGVEWISEIIHTGLDGSVTVRLSGAKPCRDIKISHDEILAVIHPDYLDDDAYSDHSEMDDDDLVDIVDFDYEESVSTISETVEYEGRRKNRR